MAAAATTARPAGQRMKAGTWADRKTEERNTNESVVQTAMKTARRTS